MVRKFIRLPITQERTGLSRSSIYAGMAAGTFPASIPLSGPHGRAVGWIEDEIDAWIEARIAEAEDHVSIHVNRAAEESGIPPEKLREFIKSGELPTYRLGRHQLVKKTALAALQKKHAATLLGAAA